jgi:hypothetical protein
MDDERWEELKARIRRSLVVTAERTEDLLVDTAEGPVKQGEAEVLEFEGPQGKMKLVREIKPKLLEKRFLYSHRAGQSAKTEYKFSESETTSHVRLFVMKDGNWQEISTDILAR